MISFGPILTQEALLGTGASEFATEKKHTFLSESELTDCFSLQFQLPSLRIQKHEKFRKKKNSYLFAYITILKMTYFGQRHHQNAKQDSYLFTLYSLKMNGFH